MPLLGCWMLWFFPSIVTWFNGSLWLGKASLWLVIIIGFVCKFWTTCIDWSAKQNSYDSYSSESLTHRNSIQELVLLRRIKRNHWRGRHISYSVHAPVWKMDDARINSSEVSSWPEVCGRRWSYHWAWLVYHRTVRHRMANWYFGRQWVGIFSQVLLSRSRFLPIYG